MSEEINQVSTSITPEELRAQKEEANRWIQLSESLTKLQHNDDFVKVFQKCYCEDECQRLVNLLAEPSIYLSKDRDMHRDAIQERLIGIARFNEFCRSIHGLAERGKKTLADIAAME